MTAAYDLNDDSVVVVIGSGAGGGTVAAELTASGVPVVCLEAGGPIDIVQDLPTMYRRIMWRDKRLSEGDLNPDLPVFIGKAVGGTSVIWGGVALRLQAHELRARSSYGLIPGTSLIDWPLTLDELLPYYVKAEKRMGVTGRQGNPFLAEHNHSLLVKTAARRLGYEHVNGGYMAINAKTWDGRPACQQFGFCAAGCVIGAKWSAKHAEIPRAEATGRFELRTHAMAVELEHDDGGRVTGVVYVGQDGERRRQRARAVCLAANGIETPRLLMLSASGRFPNGLANSAGQVGHHYITDLVGRIIAEMPGRVDNFKGTTYSALVADDMIDDPSRGFRGGYLFVPRGIHLSSFPNEPLADGWGSDYAKVIEAYRNIASMAFLGEDMPTFENRISLDDSVRDQFGNPVPKLHKRFHANDKALAEHAMARGAEMLRGLGAKDVFTRMSNVVIHNLGTCRQSADPADGVCNAFGRTHDVPNLFISDGSQFTSSGAAPPTLTIVTLAIRQAEHIVGQLKAGTL